jgi:uncharacterized protein
MKLLLLLLVVGAAAWLWRQARRRELPGDDAASNGSSSRRGAVQEDMPACRHCGTHVPRSDACFGPQGEAFCSEAHRKAHADAGSPP